jgi:hypothetical protein
LFVPGKPCLLNYALAHTFAVAETAGTLGVLVVMFHALHLNDMLVGSGFVIVFVVLLALLAAPAALIALILVSLAGPLIAWLVVHLQGGPFHVNDSVWILTGGRKNTLAQIRSVWDERGQVVVDFGQEAAEQDTDVFAMLEVCLAARTSTARMDR